MKTNILTQAEREQQKPYLQRLSLCRNLATRSINAFAIALEECGYMIVERPRESEMRAE